MEKIKLARNKVRDLIFEEINSMSDEEMLQLFKKLKTLQHKDQRKYSRKDFFRIIDYNVEGRYYRDFIENISEGGLFFKPSHTFSVGQTIQITFMSPDNQKPFRINGEIVRVGTDGVGVKFKIESQVQELVLKSFVDMIQKRSIS